MRTTPLQPGMVTVLYGTVTGNSQFCAEMAVEALRAAGHPARAVDAEHYGVEDLPQERTLLICMSTFGEGDPPDTAASLLSYLQDAACPALPELRVAVLALGDRSYDHFCKCGIDFEEALVARGASVLVPRVDCDVEFDDCAKQWRGEVVAALAGQAVAA